MSRGETWWWSVLLLVGIFGWLYFLQDAAWPASFDNAVGSMRLQGNVYDTAGVAVRGSAQFSSGVPSSANSLLRVDAQVGGTCGGFNFLASYKEQLEAIPGLIVDLSQQLISQAPMLVVCYGAPVLCDIAKHFQNFMNILIQARYAQCQQSQGAVMYAGLRLRQGQISQCLGEKQREGVSLSRAVEECNTTEFPLKLPDGSFGAEVNLVGDTLRAAGMSPEVQRVASEMMGEVTLQAGDPFRVSTARTSDVLLGKYEAHKQTYTDALAKATTELQETGAVSVPTLRSISVPGQPASRIVVEALATIQKDPLRYEAQVGRLSTTMALSKLTWECNDLQTQLAAAVDGNAHLSEEERKLLEQKYQALRRSLVQVTATVDAAEKHGAAIDGLLLEYAKLEQTATQLGLRAPAVQTPHSRYGTQQPLGYSR